MDADNTAQLPVLGWREWFALPELGIVQIKGKLDSGARSSCLHSTAVERLGYAYLRFRLPPSGKTARERWCQAPLLGYRWVTDSGGHRELRPFIRTALAVAGERWPVEISLTARETMRFPLLIGRNALAGRFLIDPEQSYRCGRHRP
ncbi:ATP-dependent zinc protease family protein [Solimonas aquatica]|uniref:ATP-dependent zinc protease family protein n=1 Tax=Solimonas aquatica TaxID=489703 RepID=UPI000B80FE10|nr:RimK/LysX family protein [Solimonas aquatica]